MDKAEVYRQLGIKLTYKPGLRLIQAEASPSGSCTKMCPEADLNSLYMASLREDLLLP